MLEAIVEHNVHCVPELYANQNFCDNFGNI